MNVVSVSHKYISVGWTLCFAHECVQPGMLLNIFNVSSDIRATARDTFNLQLLKSMKVICIRSVIGRSLEKEVSWAEVWRSWRPQSIWYRLSIEREF